MTNAELLIKLGELIKQERKITKEILELINLAEARQLYLERGFGSLFEWLTQHFGYSESAAQRRIQAARLIKASPEITAKIIEGTVNLSTLSKTQSIIRQHERITGEKLSSHQKIEVVEKIENQTFAEVEKTLVRLFPEATASAPQELRRRLDENSTRVSVTLDDKTLDNLEKIKSLLSHKFPNGDLSDIISYLSNTFLQKMDRPQQLNKAQNTESTKRRVTMTPKARREVIRNADFRCEYKDPKTGHRCGSDYQLEVDHMWPKALGGGNESENLRCFCRRHNQFVADRIFGSRNN
jgi:hypothetical protein